MYRPKGRGGDARFSLDNHDRPAEQPGASDRFVRDKLRPAKERFNALCLQGSEDKAGRDEPGCSGRLIQRLLICVGAGAERPEAPSESCSESTRPGAFEEAYSQRQRSGASYHDRTMSIGGRAGSAPATLILAFEVESRGRLRRSGLKAVVAP